MLDAARQQLAREQEYKARRRANSAATEVPMSSEYPTETFTEEIEFQGIRFDTVKYFHPRNGIHSWFFFFYLTNVAMQSAWG